jgi:hypothetical protein
VDEIEYFKLEAYEKENEDVKMIKIPNLEKFLTNSKYTLSPKSLPLI